MALFQNLEPKKEESIAFFLLRFLTLVLVHFKLLKCPEDKIPLTSALHFLLQTHIFSPMFDAAVIGDLRKEICTRSYNYFTQC